MWKEAEPEIEERYVAAGGTICPFCGSSNIEGGSFEINAGYAAQDVVCLACEREWQDSYILAGFIYPLRNNAGAENEIPVERRACDEEKEIAANAADPATGSDPSCP